MILATLGTVRFWDLVSLPRRLPRKTLLMLVQPNGLCFWACLFLGMAATSKQKWLWYHRPRSAQGFPTGDADAVAEEMNLVQEYALGLDDGSMPAECRDRIKQSHSAEYQDLELWPCLLRMAAFYYFYFLIVRALLMYLDPTCAMLAPVALSSVLSFRSGRQKGCK